MATVHRNHSQADQWQIENNRQTMAELRLVTELDCLVTMMAVPIR